MKKFLFIMLAVVLVGCTNDDVAMPGEKQQQHRMADVYGIIQRGFDIEPPIDSAMLFFYTVSGRVKHEENAAIAKVTGEYELKDVELLDTVMEVWSTARGYVDPATGRDLYVMNMSAVTNMEQLHPVNANYLTTLASDLIWYYLGQGKGYQEARDRAYRTVLECLHMPKTYSDFESYSIYGNGEGDAMLAAVSIVLEMYIRKNSSTTSWRPLDIDPETGDFKYSYVFRDIAVNAKILLQSGSLDSLRKAIEAKSPRGKVGNFEKYLSILFAEYGGQHCDNRNQGEMFDLKYDFRYLILVCSDSTWRPVNEDDFDTSTIFNPDVEYGTLVDARDGRSYRTLQIGKNTWMAENLRYSDSVSSENLKGLTWCYDDEAENCELFGRLYSWTAAMDIPSVYLDSVYLGKRDRGICPEGWHIPNSDDVYAFPGAKGGSVFSSFMTVGKNETGFSMLPGGAAFAERDEERIPEEVYREERGYRYKGERSYIWTNGMESYGSARAMYFSLSTEYEYHSEVSTAPESRRSGAYVRCVLDKE